MVTVCTSNAIFFLVKEASTTSVKYSSQVKGDARARFKNCKLLIVSWPRQTPHFLFSFFVRNLNTNSEHAAEEKINICCPVRCEASTGGRGRRQSAVGLWRHGRGEGLADVLRRPAFSSDQRWREPWPNQWLHQVRADLEGNCSTHWRVWGCVAPPKLVGPNLSRDT